MRKTKIVATIGPSCDKKEQIIDLIKLGVNVFRFNMKHNLVSWHEERISMVEETARSLNMHVGILIDLQGPELRIETKDKLPIEVKRDEEINVEFDKRNKGNIFLPYPDALKQLKAGDEFLVDDGFLEFKVVKVDDGSITLRANDDYTIKHMKGVNLPGVDLDLSSLIDADLEKLNMASRSKVDYVALSFCRSAKDLQILKKEMTSRKVVAKIVAKVESGQALENITEIVDNADAVMVARGDLGVEVPIERLTYWQKKIINLCRLKHKGVIVATQMLQSMVDNPRPTRAEATDVANAVWDGTDAVMLSGETASGKFPLKAVEAMADILAFNESVVALAPMKLNSYDITEAVVAAAIQLEKQRPNLKAFVVFTETGRTSTVLSSFRPGAKIISVTKDEKVAEMLNLSYGVISIKYNLPEGEFKLPNEFLNILIEKKYLTKGDEIVLIHGQNWREIGATNALAVMTV